MKPPVILPQTPAAKRALRRAAFLYVAQELRKDGLSDLAAFVLERAPRPIAPACESFDDVPPAALGAPL